MATTTAIKMPSTPRPWMNAIVRSMMRTPGLRRLLGRTFATITVTGSVTGERYVVPVQCFGHGGNHVVLSLRTRTWWRNLAKRPSVQLLVRGKTIEGFASFPEGDAARAVLEAVLADNPRVAKGYGVGIDDAGRIDRAGIDQLLEVVVVIVIGRDG